MGHHFKLNQFNISVLRVTEEKNAGERDGGKLDLKGKYHENLLSFQNPKMFDCQQKQRNNCQVC